MKNKIKMFKEKVSISKTTKTIVFFGFYFFFFIFLAIFWNNIKNFKSSTEDNAKEMYKTVELENNNYQYNYRINEDDKILYFSGYKDNLNEEVDNYEYKYFLDLYNIKQVIKKSEFLNKSVNSDGSNVLKYQITNKDLGLLIGNEFEEEQKSKTNAITLYTDEQLNVIKMEIDLTNYFNYIEKNMEIFQIVLEYSW